MKKFLLFLIALLSFNAYADDRFFIQISNLTVANLKDVPESKMMFDTSYPGRISGNCELIIRARHTVDMSRFAERFNITVGDTPAVLDSSIPSALVFKLGAGGYLGGIMIEAKDGRSIAENTLKALGPYDDAAVVVGMCSKLPPT